MTPKSSDFPSEDSDYHSGFGNHFSSEAIAGALPQAQNSPLVCPLGLYAEQISGTSFTAPRKLNQRSWVYRIKPSVTHEPFKPRVPKHGKLLSEFSQVNSSINPTQIRWKPDTNQQILLMDYTLYVGPAVHSFDTGLQFTCTMQTNQWRTLLSVMQMGIS